MDVLIAVHILGDAAKASCATLRTLQNLARGIRPKTPAPSLARDDCGNSKVIIYKLFYSIFAVQNMSFEVVTLPVTSAQNFFSHFSLTFSKENTTA